MQSVMFVSLGFYNYDEKIKNEIEKLGYDVTMFTPIGRYNVFEKLFNAFVKGKYLEAKSRKRQMKYLINNPKQYDYVFVIVGRHLAPDILKKYRKKQKKARFILYLWDDIARVENFNENKPNYDRIYSFDLKDVRKYGFEHLPLFYTDSHVYNGEEKKYILNMSGIIHSSRISVLDKIMKSCKLDEKKCFIYMLGTKMIHYFKAILPGKCKWMSPKYIHIWGKKFEDMAEKMKQSKVALDVQFGSQSGLTMRTFESLGSHTKLITTNKYVKEYDFYKYGNVCIIDKDNPVIPADFFTTGYNAVPEEITKKYSLSNWISTILGRSE